MSFFRIAGVFSALAFLCVTLATGAGAGDTGKAAPGDAPGNASYLAGAIIYASDIERSIRFYTEVMGLKIVARVENEHGLAEVLLSTSGKFLKGMMLTLQPARESATEAKVDPAALGVIMFMSPSNAAMARRLRDAGNEASERDPQHLFTSDPDGYRIMVYEMDTRLLNAQQ